MKISEQNLPIQMKDLMLQLYPICRSITGDGVRETLKILKKLIPLEIREVPSGTRVFDWTVPQEWNIKDAFLIDPRDKKIVDFQKSNLHVLNYSVPIRKKVSLEELKEHLFTLPDHPDWIPYRTSYYNRNWGLCIPYRDYQDLKEGNYYVEIASSLTNGSLTYGELLIKGKSAEEVLVSTHICHPSLCNDNLSGIIVSTYLAQTLLEKENRFSYRFLFIPGTIGSITWLARNESVTDRIRHGLVLVNLGDSGHFTYKRSRRGDAPIDRAVELYLTQKHQSAKILNFFPFGYDERQYCSPGFNLPVGSFMRTPFGEYPEYHTSADNIDLIDFHNLVESYHACVEIFEILENDYRFLNQNPKCEPQLGKRGLYQEIGGHVDRKGFQMAMLWLLNLSDGEHSLLDIAEISGVDYHLLNEAADVLLRHNLLKTL